MHRLHVLWDSLRSSLWFIPALLVLVGVGLAVTLVEADAGLGGRLERRWPRLFGAGAAGARGMLTAIASSTITVAGVAFSITVVALTLASSQYTSRILRNFMRDRANQAVLGVFTGVFAYCLVVLRTIRGGDEGAFVPTLAVSFAVVLAFVVIGCLIFFIHHVSTSIQASSIIQSAAGEAFHAIDRLFPAEMGEAADPGSGAGPPPASEAWQAIPARRTGYVQGVDGDALLGLAREWNAVVRMERGVGEFVVEGAPLVSVADGRPMDDDTAGEVDALFSIGRHRTTVQDAGYGVRQIVDVALKALSPGINDTTTAVICVDYLSAVLSRLARRRIETPYRTDRGKLLVIARGPTFAGLLGEAFDQIRQNAEGNVAVLVRLLEALEVIAGVTADDRRRRALRRQADLVAEAAQRSVPSSHDRAVIQAAGDRVRPVLGGESEGPR